MKNLLLLRLFLSAAILFLHSLALPQDQLKLSLQDALDRALESNLDIIVDRLSPQISKFDIQKSWGAFDPVLALGVTHQDNSLPLTKRLSIAAGGLSSIESEDTTFSGQLEGKIPTGTQYQFDITSTRDSSTFNQFDPEYSQNLSATLVQPLLKDFGFNSNLAFVRINKNRFAASKLKLQQTVMDILSQVESIYWDLVFALADLEVKKESLKLAQSILEQNRVKVKLGTLSPLEVVQAEAGVAQREEALLVAEQKVRDEENRLKRLLFKEMQTHRLIQPVPSDQPHPEFQEVPVTQRIQWALENRLDLEQLKIELSNQNILLKYYKNQSLPRIDLEGTLGLNGLGGGFSSALDNLISTDHPLWGAGLVLKYPLGNRTDRATYQQSKLQIKKTLLELKKLENDIVIQIDTAASQLETLWKRIQATALSQRFADEALRAEQKKYEAGTSTSHNVLDFEEDLAIAKSNKLMAQIDYLKVLVELERLQGTTLQSKNIRIVEEE